MTDDAEALFTQASALHSSGDDLRRSETLYRRVLAAQPRHAPALHQLGALLTQLYGKDKDAEALRLVVSAVQLQPANAKFRNSLGVVHQAAGRWRDAADAFERANEKDPLNVAVMMNLARALRESGRQQRAAEVYGAVTKLQPEHHSAHYRRGAILRSIRRNEESLAAFRRHLRITPDHRASKFWIAAITGDAEGMTAAPPDMVAGLFDQYADHFDDHLVNKLQYRTPEALRDQLLAAVDRSTTTGASGAASSPPPPPPRWRRCVDLGCGTGLLGPLLLPYCDALEGVDLSAGMVDQAAKRGCYSRLEVAELVAFLDGEAAAAVAAAPSGGGAVPYDLLVAADVFVYIGDLLPVMRAAAVAAAPEAVLAFSTEALELAPRGKVHHGQGQAAAAAAVTAAVTAAPSSDHPRTQPQGQQLEMSQEASEPQRNGSQNNGATVEQQQQEQQPGGHQMVAGAGGCPGLKLQVTGRYAHSVEYLQRAGCECGWELLSVAQSVIRNNGGEPIWGHLCVMRRQPGGGAADVSVTGR